MNATQIMLARFCFGLDLFAMAALSLLGSLTIILILHIMAGLVASMIYLKFTSSRNDQRSVGETAYVAAVTITGGIFSLLIMGCKQER